MYRNFNNYTGIETYKMLFSIFSLLLLATSLHAQGVTCPTSDSEYDTDVLILGAGMSGISAAKSLYENGVKNFMILEARDRIGGRMRSEEFGGIRVELGGHWVYGIHLDEDPPERLSGRNNIQELVERCGITGFIVVTTERVVHDGRIFVDYNTTDDVGDVFLGVLDRTAQNSLSRQQKGLPDQSVKAGFLESGWESITPLEKLMEWDFFNFLHHQVPESASLYRTLPFKVNDFGLDYLLVTDQRGSDHMLHCLAEDFRLMPNDPRLKLNTRVFRVHNGNSCVCVDTVSGWNKKTYCAKYALVTFSIGVLQSQKTVEFVPQLPEEKMDIVNYFPMSNVVRIFLQFNYTFWEDVPFIDRVDNITGRYPAFLSLDHHSYNITVMSNPSNVIVWSLTDKMADKVSSQPDWVTKSEVMELLHEMYPNSYIPEPKDFLVTNWKNDPLYYGSTVTTPVGATDEMYEVLSAPVGRLYFSGDGMHKDYSGLLHGAYYSGIETGRIMANGCSCAKL